MKDPIQTPLFIGIDGGGTATRAIASDPQGKIVGEAIAGPSNPNNVGNTEAARNILEALQKSVRSVPNPKAIHLCCGIAGLATQDSKESLRRELIAQRPLLATSSFYLTHDLEIAHFAAFQNKPGILVIAGTGSACYARTATGETHRISGRSYKHEDPGSGYAIGRLAIEMRLTPQPASSSRDTIAALAATVIDLAGRNNPVALGILKTEAHHLSQLVFPLFERFPKEIPLSLAGSLVSQENPYRNLFTQVLKSLHPNLALVYPDLTPSQAALKIARTLESRREGTRTEHET